MQPSPTGTSAFGGSAPGIPAPWGVVQRDRCTILIDILLLSGAALSYWSIRFWRRYPEFAGVSLNDASSGTSAFGGSAPRLSSDPRMHPAPAGSLPLAALFQVLASSV